MKLLVTVAFFAAALFAESVEDEVKGRKPCCRTKEPSYDCGDECGGCFKQYIAKMDFYHVKPVLTGAGKTWNWYNENTADIADDGVFTADCHGGMIDSSVFTHFNNDTIVPDNDNWKYVIYAQAPAEVPKNGDLVVEFEGSGETYKTDQNPYPKEITQLNDFRMAFNAFLAMDFDSQLAFNWYLTNDRVYIAYTRMPYGYIGGGQYYGFNFVIPVKMRKPCDWHNMKTILHGVSKTVSWRLDGREVFRVTKPGYLIDRQYMTEDYGGQEGVAFPAQINYGFGTMTKIQDYPACKRSDTCCECNFPQVRQALAAPSPATMYNPLLGPANPAIFWASYGNTVESDFIWGQGAVLKIRKLVVYQDLCAGRRC